MKNTFVKSLIGLCVVVLACVCSGCSETKTNDENSGKTAVCFVVGAHANSQGLNMNGPLVQNAIYDTVRNYGFIAVVDADGKPEVVNAASYEIDEIYKSASDEKLSIDARSKATNVIVGMQNVIANDPEVDYLESLHLAVRVLSSLDGYDSKKIIVLGTGLSTTGVLNFSNNILYAEPEVVLDLLNEKNEIPKFSDIDVYWQQLGDVASPQKDLTSTQMIKLMGIYKGIVEIGGGRFDYVEMPANPVDDSVQYPTVTPVELPSEDPIRFEADAFTSSNEEIFKEPVILTEEQVTFVGDKAIYLHPKKAKKTIRPIAEYLINNPSMTILLAGTTAGDEDSDFTMKLSLDRAKTVKKTLVELGVDSDNIITVGLGSTRDPWHIYGAGYDSVAASNNRKVVLLDATSETAVDILKRDK